MKETIKYYIIALIVAALVVLGYFLFIDSKIAFAPVGEEVQEQEQDQAPIEEPSEIEVQQELMEEI